MWKGAILLFLGALFNALNAVSALGSSCSAALASGTAAASDPYWMENIKHQGLAAFNSDPSSYTVFRNVKDYGAKGDGSTDDTDAINKAISDGTRCAEGCDSSTTTPAVVYFPSGTYVVSAPIVAYYYSQLIGDARNPPILQASSGFAGLAVIDADVYIDGGNGAEWYNNTNNFFRSVRNFKIDLTEMPDDSTATGIHWQVSQSTSLMNIVVEMSTADGNKHQGVFMENGSGGYMGDLVFNGGKYGLWLGNQQFTVRNLTINNADTAIWGEWNWGWTFQGVTINNCKVGFGLKTGGLTKADQTIGAESIIDAVVSDTPIFIQTSNASDSSLAGSLVLNNVQLKNVPTAVGTEDGTAVLEGSSDSTTIDSWGQGNVFSGTSGTATFTQDKIPSPSKAASFLDSAGRIFGKMHPQYADYAVDQFVSVRTEGAKGDGSTDDTDALQAVFDKNAGCSIIFFDHGTYYITKTLKIPAGTQMVGEAWSVIMGGGDAFSDVTKPTVMVQVGEDGDQGVVEISDIIFATKKPAGGAIVVEWNVHEPSDNQGGAGMWDTHIRLGGAAGTDLQEDTCLHGTDPSKCMSSFLALHLTANSSAYLEGTWVWNADHDLDSDGHHNISLASGRGILSESAGPVWMIGTGSEHHVMYQYGLIGAKDHYMGLIQTETPYFQPSPNPPTPFDTNSDFKDPSFGGDQMAWGLYVQSSSNILIFGAGHYAFFDNYDQSCLSSSDGCQAQIVNISTDSTVDVYNMASVGVQFQIGQFIKAADNIDGLQSTLTYWSNQSS